MKTFYDKLDDGDGGAIYSHTKHHPIVHFK